MNRVGAASILLMWCSVAGADNWPSWRGPSGQGFCEETNLPLRWSAKENVKWKIPLANQGNSTPVIWDDKIFLTQANKGGSVRSLICFSKADGKLLWQKDVAYDEKERNWNASWYANASPTLDGERVIVSFGSAGMYCYDFTGKELWKRTDLSKWEHAYGNSASPVLYENLAIQWCGPNEGKGRNFILAVNKKTGETVWEVAEKTGSWSTPLIVKINNQDQMILGMGKTLKGYDPKIGREIWSCDGLTSFVYTSALYGNGVAVGMSGYGGAAIAVKLGGTGDISKDQLWRHPKNFQRVGSGMIIRDHVYIIDENGTPRCYELRTGKEVWEAEGRPGGNTWGSMIHAEGKLYVLMRSGETMIYEARPTFKVVANNSLGAGEQTNSSIAVSGGELFIRTFKHLYCISERR